MPSRLRPDTDPTFTQLVWSWPWTRHTPARLALVARAHGLTATVEDDGGWILRGHLVTVTGHDRMLRRYHRTLRHLQRGGPPGRPPRDLLDKLQHTPDGNENATAGVRMSTDVTLSDQGTPHGDGSAS